MSESPVEDKTVKVNGEVETLEKKNPEVKDSKETEEKSKKEVKTDSNKDIGVVEEMAVDSDSESTKENEKPQENVKEVDSKESTEKLIGKLNADTPSEKPIEKKTITIEPVQDIDSDDDEDIQEIPKITEAPKNETATKEEKSEDCSEKKRKIDEEPEASSTKKQKVETIEKTFRKMKRMKRRDLEDLLKKKIVEAFVFSEELGTLRKECDKFKKSAETWQKQAETLSKNLKDLSTVQRKYINEKTTAEKDGKPVVPTKITRSVGLMVLPPEKRNKKRGSNAAAGQQQPPAAAPGVRRVQTSANLVSPRQNVPQKRLPPHVPVAAVPSRPSASPRQTLATAAVGAPAMTAAAPTQPLKAKSPIRVVNGLHAVVPASAVRAPNGLVSANNVIQMVGRPVTSSVQVLNGGAGVRPGLPPVSITQQRAPPVQNNPPKNNPEVVDLSDDDSPPPAPTLKPMNQLLKQPQQVVMRGIVQQRQLQPMQRVALRHPAPLMNAPPPPNLGNSKNLPPKPTLTIGRGSEGVVLKWNMLVDLLAHEPVISYQIFAYQELPNSKPETTAWKRVGDVKALPLPMACTLKQFSQGNKYHFAVRAVDSLKRLGPFSDPTSISV
eukprot:TRINITY_DN5405_c0_g1_i2.p1 TRINITY_DN5405_c0_g1~~TRINITY_DN5405_c0_g1_i2.p1  ORF type:complete len:634 (-),score=194.89 TRINITY_DN5405_c0_g1_i2:195-2021(-)